MRKIEDAELEEKLRQREVCVVLEDIVRQLKQLPPNGATIHKRNNITGYLDTNRQDIKDRRWGGYVHRQHLRILRV